MKRRINCWEYKQCGREPGGDKAHELGICLASVQKRANGIHGGANGGRACWAISGTLCGGRPQGSFAGKIGACNECDFYQMVEKEEGVIKDNIDILYQIGYKIK